MEINKCFLTKNSCYKKATKIVPKGIVVHSTGANNPNLKRYVQPDDGILGKNIYNNDWNRSGIAKCVHAFIGKDKNEVVRCYQTLPFNYAAWGVGKGKKGSYNNNPGYIQFEICEDNLKNEEYFNQAFSVAIEFCAYLCKEYKIPIENVVSHHESYLKGYGCNHADCDHWLKKFNKDMNWFRNEVNKIINCQEESKPVEKYPFKGKVKKGSALYNEKGTKYPSNAAADRPVEVLGELGNRYKVNGKNFNPNIVYVDKSSVIINEDSTVLPTPNVNKTHTVCSGENLSAIAKKYGTTWQKIYNDNKSIIGSNPNIIKSGQVLIIK